MEFGKNYSALVILGSWNKSIFTEDWIRNSLLEEEDKEFKVEYLAFQNFQLQFIRPRITFDGVELIILEDRLVFNLLEEKDANFNLIQDLSIKLADKLSHTPVLSYGVNFIIYEDEPEEDLLNSMRSNDLEKLKMSGISIGAEEYSLRLILNEKTLNFTTRIENNQVVFDFNLDFGIQDLSEFKEKISQNTILQLKQEAIQFINQIYGLKLVENSGK